MKQCPNCKEHFEDSQNFCDFDGAPLRDETEMLRDALKTPGVSVAALPAQKIWPIVTIGILIGIIICLGAYVVMMSKSSDDKAENDKKPETAKLNTYDRATQATIKPEALPVATVEEPVAEESPTESPTESPAETAATTETAAPSLNDGPISTNRQDGEKRGRTIIKLKSGVRVEADAAWEDRMGIWYRQGGLVSYVERDRIESIGEPPQPKTSPAETDKP
jgi:flagellar basal body-associated protein FliL